VSLCLQAHRQRPRAAAFHAGRFASFQLSVSVPAFSVCRFNRRRVLSHSARCHNFIRRPRHHHRCRCRHHITSFSSLSHVSLSPPAFRAVRFAAPVHDQNFQNLIADDQNPDLVIDERHNHAAIVAPADPVVNRCFIQPPAPNRLKTTL
jgi:hypothetical protein